MRLVAVLSVLLLTAGCVAPPPEVAPPPPPAPAPPPPPPPPPVPQGDWRDRPITPGDWSYGQSAAASTASFGRSGFAPDLIVRCDKAQRRVAIARTIGTPAPTGRIAIRTTTSESSFATIAGMDGRSAEAVLQPREPTLDAMIFSRGRFMVSMAGVPDLIVPAWAEVARVAEDCRG